MRYLSHLGGNSVGIMLIDDPLHQPHPGLLHILTTAEAGSDQRLQTNHCRTFRSSSPSVFVSANEIGALQTKDRQKRNTQTREVQGAQQVTLHRTKSSTEAASWVDDALAVPLETQAAEQVEQVQDISNSNNQNDGPETSKPSFNPSSATQQPVPSRNNVRFVASNVNNNNINLSTSPAESPSSLKPIFWLVFWDFENVNIPNFIPIWRFIRCVRSFISTVRHKDVASCNPNVDSVSQITIIGNVFQMSSDMRAEFHANGVRLMHVQSSTRKDVADKAMLTDLCMIPVHHSPPLGVALLSGDIDFSYAMARLTALGYATLVIARHNSYSPLLASSSTYIASVSDVIASANSINLNGGDFATTVQKRLEQYRRQRRTRNRAGNSKIDEVTISAEGDSIGIGSGTGKAQNEPETVMKPTFNEHGNQAGGSRARRKRARTRGTFRRGRGGHHQTGTMRESHYQIEPNEVANMSTETVAHNANLVCSSRPVEDVSVAIEATVKRPAPLTSEWNALPHINRTVAEKLWRRSTFLIFAVCVILLTVMLMLKRLQDHIMFIITTTGSDY